MQGTIRENLRFIDKKNLGGDRFLVIFLNFLENQR